jgi:two-component system, NarL family, nitrate/nitrite response regulator NarL
VLKDDANHIILTAIERVHAGQTWFEGEIMKRALDHLKTQRTQAGLPEIESSGVGSLSRREREIVALVARGLKNKQVADELSMSEGTVRNYLTAIYQKLNVSDRFGLIILASQYDL